MAEKKLTKREKLEMLLKEETVQTNAMYKELIEKEIETLKNKAENKKASVYYQRMLFLYFFFCNFHNKLCSSLNP